MQVPEYEEARQYYRDLDVIRRPSDASESLSYLQASTVICAADLWLGRTS